MSVAETDKEILESISKIYLNGKGFDLDPTFSKGNFYKDFPEPKEKSDIEPQREDVKKMDCRKLDFPREWFNSIVFDPPFLFRNDYQKRSGIIKPRNNDINCVGFLIFRVLVI